MKEKTDLRVTTSYQSSLASTLRASVTNIRWHYNPNSKTRVATSKCQCLGSVTYEADRPWPVSGGLKFASAIYGWPSTCLTLSSLSTPRSIVFHKQFGQYTLTHVVLDGSSVMWTLLRDAEDNFCRKFGLICAWKHQTVWRLAKQKPSCWLLAYWSICKFENCASS